MKLLRIKLPDQLHARLRVQSAIAAESMQTTAVEVLQKWVIEKEQYNESLRQHHERTYNNPALTSANPQKRGL